MTTTKDGPPPHQWLVKRIEAYVRSGVNRNAAEKKARRDWAAQQS